jgi:broad specificity phosphatase PhoE
MRTCWWFRHAESEINAADPPVVGGRSTWCELTPLGVAQARALGAALAARGLRPDRVVASTAVRAQQTARHALVVAGIPLRRIELAPELTELSQGAWENERRSVIYTPEVLAEIEVDPWTFAGPGAESQAEVFARAAGWLEREVAGGDARDTWVFAHGVVVKVLLAGLLGRDRRTAWRTPIDNASLTRFVWDGRWTVAEENVVLGGPESTSAPG